MQVGLLHLAMQPRPLEAHGHFLQPAAFHAARHEDHFRPVRLAQPHVQPSGDGGRGEVLVFQIDVPARAGDRVHMQFENLVGARPALESGIGAGNRHVHLADVGLHVRRPGVMRRAGRL